MLISPVNLTVKSLNMKHFDKTLYFKSESKSTDESGEKLEINKNEDKETADEHEKALLKAINGKIPIKSDPKKSPEISEKIRELQELDYKDRLRMEKEHKYKFKLMPCRYYKVNGERTALDILIMKHIRLKGKCTLASQFGRITRIEDGHFITDVYKGSILGDKYFSIIDGEKITDEKENDDDKNDSYCCPYISRD